MRRLLIAAVLLACLAAMPSTASAAGAYNDFDCKPGAKHPLPVVLVHGTFAVAQINWFYVGPALADDGYCVFALDYGNNATGDIRKSAAQLRTYVNRVRRATGAKKVALVGHSQGGMMPRWYLRFLGGARYVDELVALAPSNHGTKVAEGVDAPNCPACEQQATNSPLLRKLNRGREVEKGVDYTVIQTRLDTTIVPYRSAFLDGPKAQVTNILIQRACPGDVASHASLAFDPVALAWIRNALGRPGPANPRFKPPCA